MDNKDYSELLVKISVNNLHRNLLEKMKRLKKLI